MGGSSWPMRVIEISTGNSVPSAFIAITSARVPTSGPSPVAR